MGNGSTNAQGGNGLVPGPVWPAVTEMTVMRKVLKTLLGLVGLSLAPIAPFGQAAAAADLPPGPLDDVTVA